MALPGVHLVLSELNTWLRVSVLSSLWLVEVLPLTSLGCSLIPNYESWNCHLTSTWWTSYRLEPYTCHLFVIIESKSILVCLLWCTVSPIHIWCYCFWSVSRICSRLLNPILHLLCKPSLPISVICARSYFHSRTLICSLVSRSCALLSLSSLLGTFVHRVYGRRSKCEFILCCETKSLLLSLTHT